VSGAVKIAAEYDVTQIRARLPPLPPENGASIVTSAD